jgi:FkbM family methyltransferase
VRAGDCVWDIGANVGLYTELFADRVGTRGVVCAIEPSPECQKRLEGVREKVGGDRVRVVPAAFSDRDGEATLSLDSGPTGHTNQLSADGRGVTVRTMRGDTLLADGARAPNVMKVDVEGFEGDVLDGMTVTLKRPELRAVFVEVHFNELAKRQRANEPKRIVELLRSHGFRTKWVDASHVAALRV